MTQTSGKLICYLISKSSHCMKNELIEKYISRTLEYNQTPTSAYLFAKEAGISEADFYEYFASLEALEMEIYSNVYNQAYDACIKNELWQSYSAREKTLAVFFSLVEHMRSNRSFYKYLHDRDFKSLPKWPGYLKKLHEQFHQHFTEILNKAIDDKEISSRRILDSKYADGLWINLLFVIKYWIEDNSIRFEKTDAAIEKSVNLAFDLMSKSALDTAIDFTKFLFQRG
jgi:AcrR family transcriptional regulator